MLNHSGKRSYGRYASSVTKGSHPPTLPRLLRNRPLTFWGSLLAVVLLVASLATEGLISPNSNESQTPAPTTTAIKTELQPTQAEEGVPMWLFAAIALSCATGCGLIVASLRLRKIQRRSQSRKPAVTGLKPSPTTAVRQKSTSSKTKQRQPSPPPQPMPPVSVASPQLRPMPNFELDHKRPTNSHLREQDLVLPTVIVGSTEEYHHLD